MDRSACPLIFSRASRNFWCSSGSEPNEKIELSYLKASAGSICAVVAVTHLLRVSHVIHNNTSDYLAGSKIYPKNSVLYCVTVLGAY